MITCREILYVQPVRGVTVTAGNTAACVITVPYAGNFYVTGNSGSAGPEVTRGKELLPVELPVKIEGNRSMMVKVVTGNVNNPGV